MLERHFIVVAGKSDNLGIFTIFLSGSASVVCVYVLTTKRIVWYINFIKESLGHYNMYND